MVMKWSLVGHEVVSQKKLQKGIQFQASHASRKLHRNMKRYELGLGSFALEGQDGHKLSKLAKLCKRGT